MTVGGVPVGAVRTIIPAFAGMTVGGVPVGTVRTIIPAFAGMTFLSGQDIHEGRLCAGLTAKLQAVTPVIHSKACVRETR